MFLDLGLPAELEPIVNIVFLAVTGFIALHGIRYRDEDGKQDFVRLLFGSIAVVGLNTLVRNQVDLSQARNLCIVSVTLVFGIGGMVIGQKIRARLSDATFRRVFFVSVFIVGLYIIGSTLLRG